jgi:hypothetical protein
MSKRNKKDIKSASSSTGTTRYNTSAGQLPAVCLNGEPAVGKKETRKRAARTATIVKEPGVQEDPDLDTLLSQVDKMLTEMTQSKWLSSDWPNLEIDFGNSKK